MNPPLPDVVEPALTLARIWIKAKMELFAQAQVAVQMQAQAQVQMSGKGPVQPEAGPAASPENAPAGSLPGVRPEPGRPPVPVQREPWRWSWTMPAAPPPWVIRDRGSIPGHNFLR